VPPGLALVGEEQVAVQRERAVIEAAKTLAAIGPANA
jgi:hypothetical protein